MLNFEDMDLNNIVYQYTDFCIFFEKDLKEPSVLTKALHFFYKIQTLNNSCLES